MIALQMEDCLLTNEELQGIMVACEDTFEKEKQADKINQVVTAILRQI